MNRTVMIVICDFLLLMLVASARFDDVPSVMLNAPDRVLSPDERIEMADASQGSEISPRTAELLDTMKSSLEEEKVSREQLNAMLAQAKTALEAQQQLATRREVELQEAQTQIRAREEEARDIGAADEQHEPDRPEQ